MHKLAGPKSKYKVKKYIERRLKRSRLILPWFRLLLRVIFTITIVTHGVVLPIHAWGMEVIKLGFIKIPRFNVHCTGSALVVKALEHRGSTVRVFLVDTAVATVVSTTAPDKETPDDDANADDDQDGLAGLGVRLPLCFLDALLFLLLRRRAVGVAAYRGHGEFFAVDARIGRGAPDAGDVDAHEPVDHVAALAGHVKRHHVAGVVEEDVSQVARRLVDPSRFTLERPVMARSPHTRRGLEASPAVPLHVVDQLLRPDVVANQVLVAAEQKNRYTGFHQIGKQFLGRDRFLRVEAAVHGTRALFPSGTLLGVDVESADDIRTTEVRLDVDQIRGPVHSTRRMRVSQTDVVHVIALLASIQCVIQQRLQYVLAIFNIHMDPLCLQTTVAHRLQDFQVSRHGATVCDEPFLISVGQVRLVLIFWRDPSISKQKTPDVPLWRSAFRCA